jgi:DNA-binding CsgD family transcriptional regulator
MKQEHVEKRKQEIIEDLKNIGKNNTEINSTIYTKRGEFSGASVAKYFGSLKEACDVAGISYGRKKHKLTKSLNKRDEKIKKRVLAGETYQSIGEDYGISRERVRQCVSKLGVKSLLWDKAKVKKRDLTKEELKNVETFYSSGKNMHEIAVLLNLTVKYVSNVIKDNGFKYGNYCKCGAHVTEKNKYFHTYIYCNDCARLVFNKKHSEYVANRMKRDPKFKKEMYERNEVYRQNRLAKAGK